jgi:hypothetical protein
MAILNIVIGFARNVGKFIHRNGVRLIKRFCTTGNQHNHVTDKDISFFSILA